MIVSQTPYRISFFGGGTDYPAWFRQHGGAVLSTSINKYCYISGRHLPPFFDHTHRIVYSAIECVKTNAEIRHPSVRAVFEFLRVQRGLEIHHDGDLPARSGIGSSSSFTVGLLHALSALEGRALSQRELASLAIFLEQEKIGEAVGSQDQVAAAFGGLNHIEFSRNGDFSVSPVEMDAARKAQLNRNLMLFFTGFPRQAEVIARSKIENFARKEKDLFRMSSFVGEGLKILRDGSTRLDELGSLLHESWMLKRELSAHVSSPRIDEIYQAGLGAGALGGKLLGAGGGGFMLFYAPESAQAAVRSALAPLLEVEFEFESLGSHICLRQAEGAGHREGARPWIV